MHVLVRPCMHAQRMHACACTYACTHAHSHTHAHACTAVTVGRDQRVAEEIENQRVMELRRGRVPPQCLALQWSVCCGALWPFVGQSCFRFRQYLVVCKHECLSLRLHLWLCDTAAYQTCLRFAHCCAIRNPAARPSQPLCCSRMLLQQLLTQSCFAKKRRFQLRRFRTLARQSQLPPVAATWIPPACAPYTRAACTTTHNSVPHTDMPEP